MQAGGDRQGTGVAMVAKPRADFLHTGPQICAIGETASRKIYLVNIKGMAIDQRSKGFASALRFPSGDGHGRTVAQPDVAVDIARAEWFFEPADFVFGKSTSSLQSG